MLRINYFLMISGMFLLLFIAALANATGNELERNITPKVELNYLETSI